LQIRRGQVSSSVGRATRLREDNMDKIHPCSTLASIGDRRLHLTVTGEGTPTVILDAGMGGTSEDYALIQPAIAEFTRVCSYDRAGLGKSDPSPIPRTAQDIVDDLHALLAVASIHPPYVLVGHSWSGFHVRLYASQHPHHVVGMVLIDAVHEDRYKHFERVLSEELNNRMWAATKDPSQNDERIDRLTSMAQVCAAKQEFRFPLIVLTRGLPDEPSPVWPTDKLGAIETDLQHEFTKLSPKSRQIIAEESGHFIQKDQPELVVQAVREIVEMVRNSL
jgi:pimeloyl-ACP methyl ester carboxylesterase